MIPQEIREACRAALALPDAEGCGVPTLDATPWEGNQTALVAPDGDVVAIVYGNAAWCRDSAYIAEALAKGRNRLPAYDAALTAAERHNSQQRKELARFEKRTKALLARAEAAEAREQAAVQRAEHAGLAAQNDRLLRTSDNAAYRSDIDAMRASLASATAERDACRVLIDMEIERGDRIAESRNVVRTERDHLQARCEEQGAVRARLEARVAEAELVRARTEARATLVTDSQTLLRQALVAVMGWIDNWSPSFTEDEEWDETAAQVKAALETKP